MDEGRKDADSSDADDDQALASKKAVPRDPRLEEWPEDSYNKITLVSNLLNPIKFLMTKWSIWSLHT